MNIQPSIDLKKVNLQTAVGYLVSLHENEYQWNLLGVKVIGVAATEADIPEGTYEYGDAYEVGTEPPYDLYIYTRPDGKVHTEGYWFNTGKFPMPGPKGPKGDGVETFTGISLTHDIYNGDVYGSDKGQLYNGKSTISYKDSTTGETKSQDVYTTVFLPIVGSDYVKIDGDFTNNRFVVRLDDINMSRDYYKIAKMETANVPAYSPTYGVTTLPYSYQNSNSSLVRRGIEGEAKFTYGIFDRWNDINSGNTMTFNQLWRQCGDGNGYVYIAKTTTDTGTMTATDLNTLRHMPKMNIVYDRQEYYRMDPQSAPAGTLNYIHLDSIDDGNGGYKATGKCFRVTVSTREWQVVDLDFGGSTRTTHNLTLMDSAAGMSIYFSLTNNRPETYEGAPAGLLAALEDSQIACTVDANGTYSAGMITTDGTKFEVSYGNSRLDLIEQMQVRIVDNMV